MPPPRYGKASKASKKEEKKPSGPSQAELLAKAREALQAVVDEIRGRQGIDERTKAVMARSAENAENRRLAIKQERIEREKARTMEKIEREHLRAAASPFRFWSKDVVPSPTPQSPFQLQLALSVYHVQLRAKRLQHPCAMHRCLVFSDED